MTTQSNTESNTEKYNIIESKNRQIASHIVQTEGKKKPTEHDEKLVLNTINALLDRPVNKNSDTKQQQLNKVIMVLQDHNMLSKSSIDKIAAKNDSFKSKYIL